MTTHQKNDPTNLIKQRFGQYLHSMIVLTRAVKSCQIPEINEYLERRLKQEPRWETKWNLVYGILTDNDLPICKFCKKQIPVSCLINKQLYCSEECEKMDKQTECSKIEQTTPSPLSSFIKRLLNIFKRNK